MWADRADLLQTRIDVRSEMSWSVSAICGPSGATRRDFQSACQFRLNAVVDQPVAPCPLAAIGCHGEGFKSFSYLDIDHFFWLPRFFRPGLQRVSSLRLAGTGHARTEHSIQLGLRTEPLDVSRPTRP